MKQETLQEAKENESGRSMVEMLGTLAIIGVLSIGGVAGYGRAITSYRANTVMDAAQKKAIDISSSLDMGATVDTGSATSEKVTTGSGYTVQPGQASGSTEASTSITPGASHFSIVVSDSSGTGISPEVAKKLLENAADTWRYVQAFGVKTSGGSVSWKTSANGLDELNEKVIVILVFAYDMSPRSGSLVSGETFIDAQEPTIRPEPSVECYDAMSTCCPDGWHFLDLDTTCADEKWSRICITADEFAEIKANAPSFCSCFESNGYYSCIVP